MNTVVQSGISGSTQLENPLLLKEKISLNASLESHRFPADDDTPDSRPPRLSLPPDTPSTTVTMAQYQRPTNEHFLWEKKRAVYFLKKSTSPQRDQGVGAWGRRQGTILRNLHPANNF